MESSTPSDPIWVDNKSLLAEMMTDLLGQSMIAVDTESNSLFVYQEQVCLIQFSTLTKDYLVDPLALPDLSCLNDLFSNPSIEKIFHAADYDLVCLKRDFGFDFVNLFDTMIAAQTLGFESIGLAALLKDHFGIQADKRFQRANWGQRPLSAEMIAYAAQDSHFLIPLRNLLINALIEKDRLLGTLRVKLVQEECAYLAKHSIALQNHEADMWRIRGVNHLKPKQLVVLQSLYEHRETLAKNNNKPPFKIMNNQALLEMAQTMPRYIQELELLPSLGKSQIQRYGRGLIQAIKDSKKRPFLSHQGQDSFDEAFHMQKTLRDRKEKLSDWRRDKGLSMGVPSDVILSKDVLNNIAVENPQNLEELKRCMQDLPYRLSTFGEEILTVILTRRVHSKGNLR